MTTNSLIRCLSGFYSRWLAQPLPHDLSVGEILVFLLFRGKLTKHANHGMRQDAVQQSNYVLSPLVEVVRRAQDSRDRGSLELDLLARPGGRQKKSGDGRGAGHDGDIYIARRDFTASCPPSTHSPYSLSLFGRSRVLSSTAPPVLPATINATMPLVSADNEWSPLRSVIVGRAGSSCFPSEPTRMIEATMPSEHWQHFRPDRANPFPADVVAQADRELDNLAALLEGRGI